MLEHSPLLILPVQDDSARAWIVEPGSKALGFVARRSAGPLAWLCWWRRSLLAVHESEDEPLLLTVRQGLAPWPSWLVRDAEGNPVGRVCGRHLLDAFNQPLAELHSEVEQGIGVYRLKQLDLATTLLEEGGVRLTFQLGPHDNPFVKMVLLAATLVHNWKTLSGAERTRLPQRSESSRR